MPKGTDASFADKLFQHCVTNKRLKRPLKKKDAFQISHFAGQVTYTTSGILEKNKDPVSEVRTRAPPHALRRTHSAVALRRRPSPPPLRTHSAVALLHTLHSLRRRLSPRSTPSAAASRHASRPTPPTHSPPHC